MTLFSVLLGVGAARPPGAEEARRDLLTELRGPEYWRTWTTLLRAWIGEFLTVPVGGPRPGSVVAVLAVLLLLVLGVVVVVLVRRRRDHRGAGAAADTRVFREGTTLSAAEYRSRAATHLAAGRYEAALLDGFRAVAAEAVERGTVPGSPDLTAHEVVVALRVAHPSDESEVRIAGTRFDHVRYGGGAADRSDASRMMELDERLRESMPSASASPTVPAVPR